MNLSQCIVTLFQLVLLINIRNISSLPTETDESVKTIEEISADSSVLIGGVKHSCYRPCIAGDTRTCVYNFTLAYTTSMSDDCGKCPYKVKDCYNAGCITAGGAKRMVAVANGMLPGPPIYVCENDVVVLNVKNKFSSESTTIHFHGANQLNSPWMDGVPYVTQCPILPGTTFQYRFKAIPAGTQLWHAHTGVHEADGLFGHYIVRQANDPFADLYDYDLPEHTMIIWHWINRPVDEFILELPLPGGDQAGHDIIINGKSSKMIFTKNGKNYTTPQEVFTVKKNKRYRFRTIFNSLWYCPLQFSIDGHNLTMIMTDNGEFKPIEVESFIANAGERYDFILHTNAKVDSYWIRLRGLGECLGLKIHQEAVLRYKGAAAKLPKPDNPTYEEAERSGRLLNPIEQTTQKYPNNQVIKISELEGNMNINGTPDLILYLEFRMNSFPKIKTLKGLYPQINNITFEYPHSPLLTQWWNNTTCNLKLAQYNCIKNFCTCPQVISIKKDALVEMFLINTDKKNTVDHAVHLHGQHYRVIAMETVGKQISVEYVHRLNSKGKIPKKLYNTVLKDTISLPNQGYAALRFWGTNLGYWFMHCHFTDHTAKGMAIVLKVGEDGLDIPYPPPDIPACGDFPSI